MLRFSSFIIYPTLFSLVSPCVTDKIAEESNNQQSLLISAAPNSSLLSQIVIYTASEKIATSVSLSFDEH